MTIEIELDVEHLSDLPTALASLGKTLNEFPHVEWHVCIHVRVRQE
jgi:hypothetical protein